MTLEIEKKIQELGLSNVVVLKYNSEAYSFELANYDAEFKQLTEFITRKNYKLQAKRAEKKEKNDTSQTRK